MPPATAQFVLLASLNLHPGDNIGKMMAEIEMRINEKGGFVHPGTGIAVKGFTPKGSAVTLKFSDGAIRHFDINHATSGARLKINEFLAASLQQTTTQASSPPLAYAAASAM